VSVGELSVINEDLEEETVRSEKSLASLFCSPNKMKLSIDMAEAAEFKERNTKLQQEK
jgi:hypothetical protein